MDVRRNRIGLPILKATLTEIEVYSQMILWVMGGKLIGHSSAMPTSGFLNCGVPMLLDKGLARFVPECVICRHKMDQRSFCLMRRIDKSQIRYSLS